MYINTFKYTPKDVSCQLCTEYVKKLSETALQQINDKKNETELTTAGVRTIYKYGVAFSGKKVEVAVG